MRFPFSAPATLAVAAVLLAGCGSSAGGTSSSGTDAAGGEAAASQDGFPRTVEHVRGSTEIPQRPQRVVALDAGYVDSAVLLDVPLVGYATLLAPDEPLPDYLGDPSKTSAADAVPVGLTAEVNLEAVAALEPDLIVSADIRHADLYDQLSSIAPTVFSETTGPTWKDNIELFAEATGAEDAADAELTAYQERATAIGAEVNAAASDPEVSILRFSGEGTARLYQSGNFSGIVLADAGLARPENQRPAEFNLDLSEEQLLQADADVVVVSSYAQDTAAADRARFEANPLWGRLTGRVVEVDDNRWMLPVSLQGAHLILDDLAEAFDVDPATPSAAP